MAYAFNHPVEGAPRIGELLAARFPHFDSLVVPFEGGQEVVGEGDPTENFYLVMRGMFRAVKFTRDGRRQVFAFYMPGDICGLEPDESHKLTIEAVDCRGDGDPSPLVLPHPHERRPPPQCGAVRRRDPGADPLDRSHDDDRPQFGGGASGLVPDHALGAVRLLRARACSISRCSGRTSQTISA